MVRTFGRFLGILIGVPIVLGAWAILQAWDYAKGRR